MKTITKILAFAATAASLTGFAESASANTVYIRNNTPHAIWYTVYNAGFRTQKKAWGCVLPNQEFKSSDSAYGRVSNFVYVLGEVKESTNSCSVSKNKWTIGETMVTLNSQERADHLHLQRRQSEAYRRLRLALTQAHVRREPAPRAGSLARACRANLSPMAPKNLPERPKLSAASGEHLDGRGGCLIWLRTACIGAA